MNATSLPSGTSPEHRHYRVGLFWPVVLIGLGVVLLLNNVNALPGSLWDWLLRLWPVLLIAWGLDDLFRLEFVSATLLTVLGVAFLLANLGIVALSPWPSIVGLWPLLIVAAGISLIFNRRWVGVAGSLVGAVVILGILLGALWLSGTNFSAGQVGVPVTGQTMSQEVGSATKANLILEPVAGMLTLKALSEPTALIAGTINLQGNDTETINRDYSINDGTATLRLKSEGGVIAPGPWGGTWHAWNLGVNPALPTSIEVNMGAGDINLDLTELNVSRLDVKLGAGSISVTLPRSGAFTGRVNSAVGSTTVIIPSGVGIRLVQSGGLVVVNVPLDFTRNGKEYTSPGYSNAVSKIDLAISQAIGSVTFRYESGR